MNAGLHRTGRGGVDRLRPPDRIADVEDRREDREGDPDAEADLEITWVGRIAVFLIMGGIFWSMVVDWEIIEIGFCVGVALSIFATILYVRDAIRRTKAINAAAAGAVQSAVQPSSSD